MNRTAYYFRGISRGIAAAAVAAAFTISAIAENPRPLPSPATASVVLAGGCFWGMQGVFEHVKGETKTMVGYAGGTKETAHYDMVAERNTAHAEAIRITWDPSKVTFGDLLKVYFGAAHDPTTLNRQHYDEGPEYRSAIFYTDEEQKNVADEYIRDLNNAHVFRSLIVTQVVPLHGAFFPAESEHQHFLDRNPTQGYIAAIDIPLLNGFKEKYPELYTREIR
jgi:peptide-methionine (S)-S-oxide reductase